MWMTARLPTWRAGGGYKYIARLEHLYNLLTKCKKYILNSLGAKHKDVMLHAKMWQWRFINKYKKLLGKTAQMLRKMERKRWLQLSDRNRQEIQVLL